MSIVMMVTPVSAIGRRRCGLLRNRLTLQCKVGGCPYTRHRRARLIHESRRTDCHHGYYQCPFNQILPAFATPELSYQDSHNISTRLQFQPSINDRRQGNRITILKKVSLQRISFVRYVSFHTRWERVRVPCDTEFVRIDDLAHRLGLEYEGDGGVEIHEAAPLDAATSGQLAFLASAKSAPVALGSRACLIVPAPYPRPDTQTVLRADNPRAAFARALALLYPDEPARPSIHRTACIEASASIDPTAQIGPHACVGAQSAIGAGVLVGPGCVIGAQVHIGARSRLHPHVTIYDRVRIGPNAVIHSGAVIGADGFGFAREGGKYQKFPQVGTVEIGDDVEIGANTCIDRAALGVTRIGSGVKLDNLVHIAHNCRIGNNVVIAAQTGLSGGIVVEDDVVIGGQVGIGDKARIERGAVLGSGCGVLTSKIVRGGQVVWGTPARPLKEYLEQLAVMARLPESLPEVRRQLRDILQRLEALESR
jgi:UDP-3-O-[3-hydroxymyristoyl] glucosamine N-acyltransferase